MGFMSPDDVRQLIVLQEMIYGSCAKAAETLHDMKHVRENAGITI